MVHFHSNWYILNIDRLTKFHITLFFTIFWLIPKLLLCLFICLLYEFFDILRYNILFVFIQLVLPIITHTSHTHKECTLSLFIQTNKAIKVIKFLNMKIVLGHQKSVLNKQRNARDFSTTVSAILLIYCRNNSKWLKIIIFFYLHC